MPKSNHPFEKLIKTIIFKGVEFEVIERPDVIWVGCVDYAKNSTDESDIHATFTRYLELKKTVPKNELINPDYSAAISINYNKEKPYGLMFAVETYSDKQDERYELFTQPSGLWLRITISEEADIAFFGVKNDGSHLYFHILRNAAEENGYRQNPNIDLAINYDYHPVEDKNETHPNYVYIPIIEA